jgi:ornithine cyclodeaminase
MPALLAGDAGLGAKLVSVVPGNAARDLPTHLGVVALFTADTGALLAIMDARCITEVRTAAVSAVSVRYLAREESSVLAVIGTGVQARSHAAAISTVRRLTEVRAWSPSGPRRISYAREMSQRLGLEVCPSETPEDAMRGADLVVLATSSDEPVVRSEWVADGAHVVSVGACRPHQREMDPALVARARLVVDSRAAALAESGDIVQGIAAGCFSPEHVAGELGEVAAGTVRGRTGPGEVTIFKSLGLAVEDIATAALVSRRARERGLGVELAL